MDVFSLILGVVIGGLAVAMLLLLKQRKAAGDAQFLQTEHKRLQEANQSLEDALNDAREQQIKSEAERGFQEARLKEQSQQLETVEKRFSAEFQNLTQKIFEESSKKFGEHSQKQLGEVLNPLKERLHHFQEKVDKSFGEQAKEQFSLKKEIERITTHADELATALRGDVKTQGDWGEMVLERLLEDAGLIEGVNFTLQGAEMGLKDARGRLQKPDVILHLPDGKHLIIDAKCSLTHYEQMAEKGLEEQPRQLLVKQFITSMRSHVNGLAERRYQDNPKLGSPDFVLMFVPIEGAYALACQEDQKLHPFAWEKKVVIVSPVTLFATLRTIGSLWQMEQQNQNAEEIARQAGGLYDKFVGFAEDLEKVELHMGKARGSYDEAKKKLVSGHGNLSARAEKLKKLGAKTSKAIPAAFKGDSDAESDTSGADAELQDEAKLPLLEEAS